MKLKILSGAGLLALATVISFSPAAAADPVDLTAHSYGKWGFDLTGRDTAVKPGDDFFSYANGAYLQKTAIPADRTWYGTINVASTSKKSTLRPGNRNRAKA